MKILTLKKNTSLSVVSSKIPKVFKDECLIKISYCGICSSDIPRIFNSNVYFYPIVLGHEISGKIVKVGSAVSKFKKNDHVSVFPLIPCKKCSNCKNKEYNKCINYKYYGSRNNGGFSEYLSVKEWNLFKLKKTISLKEACLMEPLSVCIHAIKLVKQKYNKNKRNFENLNILIIGSGFLGLTILEILAKLYKKNRFTIIDKNNFKLKYAIKKANKIVSRDSFKENKKNNDNFDVIFEVTGNSSSFKDSINYASRNGVVLWMGNINEDLIIPKNIVSNLLRKELTIIGSWNSDFKKNRNDDWSIARNLLNTNFKLSHLISHEVKLESVRNQTKKIYEHKIGKKSFRHIKTIIKL